jgi:hypothetical protein
VLLIAAPEGFEATLGSLPAGARLTRQGERPAKRAPTKSAAKRTPATSRGDTPRVILLFVRTRADLVRRFPGGARKLAEGGRLWIAWPKKTSGMSRDLGEKQVRAFGLAAGFVDYKICAVDETWSGLCFARRESAR